MSLMKGDRPFFVAFHNDRISFAGASGAASMRLVPGVAGRNETSVIFEQMGVGEAGPKREMELLRGPSDQIGEQFYHFARAIDRRSQMPPWATAVLVAAVAMTGALTWEGGKWGYGALTREPDALMTQEPVRTSPRGSPPVIAPVQTVPAYIQPEKPSDKDGTGKDTKGKRGRS